MGDNTLFLSEKYPADVTDPERSDLTSDAASDDEHDGAAPPADAAPRRRSGGLAGAALGAAMFGLDQVLGRKPREEAPIVVDASGQPKDLEDDGIHVPIDDTASVWAPPQPRSDPTHRRRRRRRA